LRFDERDVFIIFVLFCENLLMIKKFRRITFFRNGNVIHDLKFTKKKFVFVIGELILAINVFVLMIDDMKV